MNAAPQPCCWLGRAAAVAVGLFATWQLVSLPAANLIHFVPTRPAGPPLEPDVALYQAKGTFTTYEPLQQSADRAAHLLALWGEVTGTEQGWSLFAPGPPPFSTFAAVEFRWADGTADTLLSPYEPADYRNAPLRAPLVNTRHYHYESQFVMPVWYASPAFVAEKPDRWADMPDVVRGARPEIRAWLNGRLNDYLRANPHRGRPQAVILKHRYISTPKPEEPRDTPRTVEERPFARWWPDTDTFDAFDIVTNRYVPVGGQP